MSVSGFSRIWRAGCLSILLVLVASAVQAAELKYSGNVHVDPALIAELAERGTTTMVVYLHERADLTAAHSMPWDERGHFVHEQLQAVADRSQANLRRHLDQRSTPYRAFWIDNVIVIEHGDRALLDELVGFSEIQAIIAEPEAILIEPEWVAEEIDPRSARAPEPNIAHIGAPDVWAQGITGSGITVASIDTGVRYTHQALVNSYRGNLGGGSFDHDYNWWNPYQSQPVPEDSHNHGSHVTGTMTGDDGGSNQTGVAPGAKWIACRGFNPGASTAGLLECGQFMAAPWDQAGQNPDPARRPHVVNNSWGDCGTTYNTWYEGVIDSWIAAGIAPIFSNGNSSNCGYPSPPGLNTVGNPARSGKVMGIGSTGTSNGQYATHSNWGPTDNPNDGTNPVLPDPMGYGNIKPNVAAPGVSIRSSGRDSDSHYYLSTGTSMAGPHAAALVALMWDAAPCLIGDYATTGTIMMQSANGIDYATNNGDEGPGNVPNHATGWGEINAVAAVDAAISACGPQGTLAGQVTEAGSNTPLEGALVTVTNFSPPPPEYLATTDEFGNYSRILPENDYDVTASKFGYLPQTVTDVEIIEDETTVLNFVLSPAPSWEVSGQVTDAETGWPLYASIDIQGSPYTIWTDPVDGSYSITLPEGIEYEFVVNAWVDGYETYQRTVGPLTGNSVEDFGLEADLASCTAPGYSMDFVYYEGFVATDGGFTLDGPAPAPWQWGAPQTWPSGCVDGPNCWGTNLSGNYNNNANQSILSPVIDLSGVTPGEEVTARWHQAWHIESATWDQAYAEVSVDGGPWQVMWQHTGSTVQVGWTEMTYDLSAAAGTNAQFRFRLVTDSSVVYNGYYIDALAIATGDDCEPAAGGLVVGNVYDANTNAPLSGALVLDTATGEAVVSVDTPADPAVNDGFFTLFVEEGSSLLEASHTGEFGQDSATVNMVDGTTMEQPFWLPAGWIEVHPVPVEITVEFGQTDSTTMMLTNTGGLGANFELQTLLLAEDFEQNFPPSGWTVLDNGGDCVWLRNDEWPRPNFAGGDGFSAAADADACGNGTTMNTELHTPMLDFTGASVATLDFVASYRHLGSSSFSVHVSTDGGVNWDTLMTWTANVDPTGPGAPVSLDLTPYVGSAETLISFHYIAPGWDWWAQVDQIRVTSDAGSWLAIAPSTGTLAPGGGQEAIELTFDASAVPEPGQYSASVLVGHDTPYQVDPVPVIMNVTPPADLGLLDGVVLSQGHCDGNPEPVENAEVTIEGATETWTRYTDENGYYYIYVVETESPLTVSVDAAGHESGLETGVIVTGQQTTEVNFDLRAFKPCMDASPDSMSVNLLSGQSTTLPLTLTNDGASLASFVIHEMDEGYDPLPALAGRSWTYSEPAAIGPASVRSDEGRQALAADGFGVGGDWTAGASLPAGDGVVRYGHAQCAEEPDSFYVISGVNEAFNVTDKVWRYDAVADDWQPLANIPAGQEGISAICHDGYIYALGGGGTNQMFIYDIAGDIWLPGPALPRNVWGAAVGAYLGEIFMIGGDNDFSFGGTSDAVNIYDIAAGDWVGNGAAMPTAAGSAGFAQAGQYVYVVGGWGDASPGSNINQTQRYDMLADDWETGPTFGSARGDFALALTGTHLYAIGGDADGGGAFDATAVVESYDHTAWPGGSWGAETSLPGALTAHKGGFCTEAVGGGEVWSVGGFSGAAVVGTTQYLDAESCFTDFDDVEWLEQDPESGGVGPDSSLVVDVTFTALPALPTGIYTATMVLMTGDSNNPRIDIPVTMNILEELYGVEIDPASASDSADPGQSVIYTLEITNTGTATDTFELSLSGQTWNSELSTTSVTLDASESTSVTVTVDIPAGAGDGAADSVVVTAESTEDPLAEAEASSVLTTGVRSLFRDRFEAGM